MKGVSDCKKKWGENPDNLDKMLKYIKRLDLVPFKELDIYLYHGPFTKDGDKVIAKERGLSFVCMT